MERRTSFPPLGDASVTLLSNDHSSPFQGRITAVADGFVRVQLAQPVELDAAVRLDVNEGIVLGEVVDCRQGPSGYEAFLCIDQVIPSVPDLAKLVSAVMNQGTHQRRTAAARTQAPS